MSRSPSGASVDCERDHGLSAHGWLHVDDLSPCGAMNDAQEALRVDVLAMRAQRCENGSTNEAGPRCANNRPPTPRTEVVMQDDRTPAEQAYAEERSTWIAENGSRRLKLAAERGYKHDGIYRDERAAIEAPGFVALRRYKVKQIVNPSIEAIDAETEALEAHPDLTVELVWLHLEDADCDLPDGEYVQLSGFLGKHTLYRPVHEEVDDDE